MSEDTPIFTRGQSLALWMLSEATSSAMEACSQADKRREHVLLYLRSTEASWRLSANFEHAYWCRKLRQVVERSSTVHNARRAILQGEWDGPASNTGPPTPSMQQTLFDYLGGTNGRDT